MTDFTHENLKAVEDQAPKYGMEGLEYRAARGALALTESGLSYMRLDPGHRLPFGHAHKTQEEIYVLLSGSARLKLDDEIVELKPFDAVRIATGVMRNLEGGPEGAELLLFGAPQATDDAPMVQDWWQD
jgi:uncharacterized cupin superfamily protein